MSCLFPGKRQLRGNERGWFCFVVQIFIQRIALNQKVWVWYTQCLQMERELPTSFSQHQLLVEWKFPLYFMDIMEIMSTQLEVIIKMSLSKCYGRINKKHTEFLPSSPINIGFSLQYLFLLFPFCFSLLIDVYFIKMLQNMYCLL